MNRTAMRTCAAVLLAIVTAGCQQQDRGYSVFNPFNLKLPFLPHQDPVRIGIAADTKGVFDPETWDLLGMGSPWNPLAKELEKSLNRPVQIERLQPFQVAAQVQTGRLDFGLVGASDYLALSDEFGDLGEIVAVSDNAERKGLIVANARSDIHTIEDLRGKRFSFGPPGDPVLDMGAKKALEDAGLPVSELQKEVVAINKKTLLTVNSLQHHISANESAYEIAYGLGTHAGVIEADDYDRWPETGGSMLLRTYAKDRFRILGATEEIKLDTMPEGPVIVSKETDPELRSKVSDFLLSAHARHRDALMAMGMERFRLPDSNVKTQMEQLAASNPDDLNGIKIPE